MQGIKTGGRNKGTPNKITSNIKEKIFNLLENQFETIEADLHILTPKDRLDIYIKLLPYVIPKQLETINYNDTDLNIEVETDKLQQLKQILMKIDI